MSESATPAVGQTPHVMEWSATGNGARGHLVRCVDPMCLSMLTWEGYADGTADASRAMATSRGWTESADGWACSDH